MSVADKLLQINQVKQDIKQAIENKGVPMTNVAFTEYANKIADISGGVELDLFLTAAKKYHEANLLSDLEAAWQKKVDSETILYDIPLTRIAQNQDIGMGTDVDIYTGDFTQLWADCNNHTLLYRYFDFCEYGPNMDECPPNWEYGSYIINDILGIFMNYDDAPIQPFYLFFNGVVNEGINGFLFADLGSGVVMCHPSHLGLVESFTLREGFIRGTDETTGIIVSDLVTEISTMAFFNYGTDNKPLVLPNTITAIGEWAFAGWLENNYPLVIPNGVTSIGDSAFYNWRANNQPLVIPNSVTTIGNSAFYNWQLVPYIEIQATTPPTLAGSSAFSEQNNAPIYVPDASVTAYKTATNWVDLADRIFSINDK